MSEDKSKGAKSQKKIGRRAAANAQKKSRDYKEEYRKFQSSDEQKAKRALRNKNRREAEREGRVKKGDGKDIHHDSNGTRVEPRSVNRGRREKSRKKGSTRQS